MREELSVLIRLPPNDCSRGGWSESGVRSHFREPNVIHTDIGQRKNGSLWDTQHSLGATRVDADFYCDYILKIL